jgi:hypothetical protein
MLAGPCRTVVMSAIIVAMLLRLAASPIAAGQYPLTLAFDAQASSGTTTVTTTVNIYVNRLMEENRRIRVTDALKHGGFGNFVLALRPLPPVGAITIEQRKAEIRYAREQEDEKGRRLLLIADSPIFFLGSPEKSRTGYELTVVELRLDTQGHWTGQMAGAARVKPANGEIVLDNFAEALVPLSPHVTAP